MNKSPLVTVYTINRNYSKFLDKCINSELIKVIKKLSM